MKYFYKFLAIILFQLCFISTVESQTINIVRFNNTTSYTPGSGVSVIINPTGIFDLYNQFILELSNVGGTFPASPTILKTLDEFYVPVINGTLPAGLAAGTYKLRVRSTNPVFSVETNSFTVVSGGGIGVPNFKSGINNDGSTKFNCLTDCSSIQSNNVYGQIDVAANNTTSILNNTELRGSICNFDNNATYQVNLINIANSNITNLNLNAAAQFSIPNNLPIGTYIIEIEKKISNIISVFSNIFIFHGSATNINNLSSETVCVGNKVQFSIDATSNGIGRNYMGSKYTIDFGDDSPILTYTHSQLLQILSTPELISHTFNNVSCSLGTSPNIGYFIVKLKLFNKGVFNSGNNANYCNQYFENGNGADKRVNTNRAPVADFNLTSKQCVNSSITATNTTVLGQYGTTNCLTTPRYYWYVKRPTDTDFLAIDSSFNPSWLVGNNLVISASFVNIPGCWQIKLEAQNAGAGCTTTTEMIKTIKIEVQPTASFTFNPLSPICPNTQIQFTNTSNVVSLPCQEPTYLWTVSPSTGYQFVNPSNSASKDPLILFTNPDIYTVTLSVTNSCGTVTYQKTIEVAGSPTVSFNPSSLSICSSSPPSHTIDFSQSGTKPIYSPPPFAPNSYSWSITGTGVTASDYAFVGGTNSTSQYPKITFTSFKTYLITVTVNGNCLGSGQATFTFALKETPIITNTNLTQTICSNNSTAAIPLTSNLSVTTFNWTVTATSGITGFTTPGNGNSIPASVLTNPTNGVGTVTYTVIPTYNGCIGSPVSFVITVNPKPFITSQLATICSGKTFTVTPVNGSGNIVPTGTTYTWTDPISNPLGAITGGSMQTTDQTSISQNLTNTTSSTATLTYTVTPKSNTSGSCIGNTFTVTITINPTPAPLVLTNQEYCNGVDTTPTIFSNAVAGTTYVWTNSNPTIGLNTNGSVSIPAFTPKNTGSSPITATISVTPTANGCPGATQTFTITVNPSPVVNFSIPNQTICSGDTSTLVTLNSVTGATFNWTAIQPTGISGVVTSGNNNTIPPQTLINNTNASIIITYNTKATLSGGATCAGAGFPYTITVKPKPVIAANMTAVTCSGSLFTVTPTNGAGNSIPTGTTYSWASPVVTAGLTGGTLGTNAASISGTLTNTTNTVQTATYTVIPSSSGCAGLPFDVVVSVNPKSDVDTTPNVVLCAGEISTLINFTGNVSATNFSWSSNTTSIGIAASGTNSISSFTAINTGTTPIIATITVTPTANSCPGSSKTLTITVNPKPTVSPIANIVRCNGIVSGPISFSGNVTGTTFDWTNDTPSIGLAATGNGPINSFTTTNTGLTPITATITVTPKANGCPGTPILFTITINPTPTVDMISNQTVCNGQSTTAIVFSGTIPNTIYNWTNSNLSIGLGASGVRDIPTFTAINSGTTPIVAAIKVTPILDGCSSASKDFTFTINPSPAVTFSPTNQILCSGSSSVLVNLSSAAGTNFTWTADLPTGITGVIPSGTNTIPVQTLINLTNRPIVVTYLATAESNNGIICQGISYPYTITVNPVPSITITQAQTICSNGTFSIIPSDGSGNSVPLGTTYSWGTPVVTGGITGGATASNQATISGSLINTTDSFGTATYTVTPKSGSCLGTAFTAVVTINPAPKVQFSGGNQKLCSGSDSLPITLTSTTTGNVTFNWTANIPTGITGATTSGTSAIPTQTLVNTTTTALTVIYTATATVETNGVSCTGLPFDYKITVNPTIVTSRILSVYNGFNVSAVGATDGSIDVTISGGSGAYTYLWSGQNGFVAISQDISNVPAGTYLLTINDGLCNPVELNFTLTSPLPLIIEEDLTAHTNILCFGYLTGTIKVNITQESVGPYDYVLTLQGGGTISTITDSAAINQTFSGLAAGTYDIKVMDANGSVKTIPGIVITQPSGITATTAQTNVSCKGSTTGSATVTATGGNGSLTYSWNTNPIQTTATATGLKAGTYTVTITDENTCSLPKQVTITEPNAIITSVTSKTDVLCFGNNTGSATVSASGGTGFLNYSWNTVPIQTTATATGLVAGNYTLTVTDANSCQKIQDVTINQPSAVLSSIISNSTDVSCLGGNDGTASTSVIGGTAPYSYSWNTIPVQILATATGLKAGNYTVTISDGNGCITSASVTINEPLGITTNITKTDVLCSGNSTGSATVTANGGTPPYSYSWNTTPIQTSNVALNLPLGTYTATITDTKGCATTAVAIITEPNGIVTSIASQTNVDCFGNNTGAVTISASGGKGVLTYSWDTIPAQNTLSLTGLTAGNYNLTVTDENNCKKIQTVTITEPDDIIISTISEKDITCFNDANGAIDIAVSGGTVNYTFAWTKDGIPYSTTEDLSNLSPGTYIVSVSDANICGPKTATFTITQPPILAVSLGNKNNILCFGDATGTITVNVLGGTLPYTYAWKGPNGFTSSNQNLTALFAGAYDLVVTDNSGCFKTLKVTLTQPNKIEITATTTPIICYGGNDASINIVVSGGVAPYQILWSNLGNGTFQDNLSAGDYIITVTDALNCTKKLKVNIPEAPIFTVNPVVKNISCHGANDGSIALNFVGGIPPINLSWSDGSNAGTTRNNLKPGTYSVTIIDGKPCTISKKFVILEPQLLVVSANLTNAFDCDNANSGAINLLVSGGSAPFTYTWSNGATTEDLVNVPAGNYLVTVTDVNGCSRQAQYSINRPPPLVAGVITKTDFDCATKSVKQTFVANVSGGVPPYILTWSSGTVSGANNEMMNTTQNGAVILYVTDAIGCTSNYTFNVDLPELGTPSFDASSYAYLTYGTYSINDPIQFSNTATGDYISMVWDFGDGSVSTDLNPLHTFVNPKEYVVTQTVTYPLGCIYVQKIIFNVGKGYVLVVPNAFTPNKDTFNDFFRPVTKGLKNVRLDVYDTWGSLIYSETGTVLRGWDAKIKASNAENGNYYCKVSGETFYGTIVNENHPFVLIK
jgi:gliding motility-associated-like protein